MVPEGQEEGGDAGGIYQQVGGGELPQDKPLQPRQGLDGTGQGLVVAAEEGGLHQVQAPVGLDPLPQGEINVLEQSAGQDGQGDKLLLGLVPAPETVQVAPGQGEDPSLGNTSGGCPGGARNSPAMAASDPYSVSSGMK